MPAFWSDTPRGDALVLRNNLMFNSVFGLLRLGVGLMVAVGGGWRWIAGEAGTELKIAVFVGIALVAVGLYDMRLFLDRRAQVMLGPEGFSDRRLGHFVVPWSSVAAVSFSPGKGSAMVRFHLDAPPGPHVRFDFMSSTGAPRIFPWHRNTIQIEISVLDTSYREIFDAVRRFAPHVEIMG